MTRDGSAWLLSSRWLDADSAAKVTESPGDVVPPIGAVCAFRTPEDDVRPTVPFALVHERRFERFELFVGNRLPVMPGWLRLLAPLGSYPLRSLPSRPLESGQVQ